MEMRVEQLAERCCVSVDTVRYYQNKSLLDPPRREGRVAWYSEDHAERIERIRSLQQQGFSLATIAKLLSGELDRADEALLRALTAWPEQSATTRPAGVTGPSEDRGAPVDRGPASYTLSELADATGVPLALLRALEAEGLLVARNVHGADRYTDEDVAASNAGLLLLEWGIPLSALLDLARRHHEATEEVARQAVALFATHIRGPLRSGQPPAGPDPGAAGSDVDRLLQAYAEMLPAVSTLVGHHFTRTLTKAALGHVDEVGSPEERRAVSERLASESLPPGGHPSPSAGRS
jgi:DNA-binding transcriptional MerR regulator